MIRLDEHALLEDDAYRAAYELAMTYRAHMEAVYRGLYDAVVADLRARFAPAGDGAASVEAPPHAPVSPPIHQPTSW